MKMLTVLLILLVLAGVGLVATAPATTMERLRTAAASGDRDALADVVDFPRLRESLKTDMRDALGGEDADREDDSLSRLGGAFAALIGDRLIDAFVTPDAIASLARGYRPDGEAGWSPREYTVDRTGLDTFAVDFEDEGPRLHFDRYGIRWKLVRVELRRRSALDATGPAGRLGLFETGPVPAG